MLLVSFGLLAVLILSCTVSVVEWRIVSA